MEELNYFEESESIATALRKEDSLWVKTFESFNITLESQNPVHINGLELPTAEGLYDNLADGDYTGEDGELI